MKKGIILVLLAACAVVSVQAQGTILFNNRNTAVLLDAPIIYMITGQGPGPEFAAGLFFDGMLIPGSVTRFRDGSENPLLARYIEGITVTVPGTTAGQNNVTVEMRVWFAAAGSYEAATPVQRGNSGPLVIAELGGGIDPSAQNHLPPTFTGIQFPIVPEPSTVALIVCGALILFGTGVRGVSGNRQANA